MKEAAAQNEGKVSRLVGANNPIAPLVSARLIDSTDCLAIEADMLERLMGAELEALFRNNR